MLIALTSCKSNTAFTRSMAGLTTKYNIHFNGNEAYKQGLAQMEQNHEDDYSRQLMLHPVYKLVGQDEPSANADFTRAIDKCKKSVQTKSISKKPHRKQNNSKEYREWLNRGEWNPYIHNAWLLSGKAQFYQGDFNAAQATFTYVIRHFSWLPLAIAQSHIWIARCHAVQGFTYDAESELNLIVPQKKYNNQEQLSRLSEYQALTPQLQREFSLAQAEILLQKNEDKSAIADYLTFARKIWTTREQRIRAQFLTAQIQEELHQSRKAYDTYGKIIRQAKDYRTQFNARIAQTRVMQDADLNKAEKKLIAYSHQRRNEDYLDQVFYALGNVALLQKDTTKAIIHFQTALDNSTRNGMDKAVAALRLGEISFMTEDYVLAQKAYSTAMGIIKSDYPNYEQIAKTSSVLDELQTHAETIQLQDSLLYLASLPDEQLNKAIDKVIANLIKAEKEAEEAQRMSDYDERVIDEGNHLAEAAVPQPVIGPRDDSWYFYNTALVNAGKTEFQRIWGSRRPEDDWRRRNKTSLMTSMPNEEEAVDSSVEVNIADNTPDINDSISIPSDPHSREFYIAQIPFSEEQKANANQLIEDGMYNMGVIINEKLENLPLAIRTFQNLERRYPETPHRLEFFYAIYLMYMRMEQPEEAEVYRKKLMHYFPESAYAIAVSDPNYIDNLRHMAVAEDSLYTATYQHYLASESSKVHENYEWAHEHWPLTKLMPKFLFLHALSFVQEGDIESFREALEQLTALYPSSDVSPLAGLMVKGVHEGRNVQLGETAKGMEWKSSLQRQGDASAADSISTFIDDDDLPHLLLIAYNSDSISQNDLLFEVAKFNFENYLIKDFDLEIMQSGDLSVLVISSFTNLDELIEYHDRMDQSKTIGLPDGIFMIDISEANFRALLSGKTFDEYFQWVQETYGNVE